MSMTPQELSDQLRAGGVDFAADAHELRRSFEAMLTAAPPRTDVEYSDSEVVGVPVVVTTPSTPSGMYFVYVHGGGFSAGTARAYAGFSATLSATMQAIGVSVEYKRSPEAPFPAGLNDVVDVVRSLVAEHGNDRVSLIGDSAGGGLVISALVALRESGSPLPACVVVLSPWVDLTCTSGTMTSRDGVDPSLNQDGLRRRASEYANGVALDDARLSPLFADLHGLPPILVQVGTDEVLLDDAVALAAAAARADVNVDLQVRAHLMHVFPSFAGLLQASDTAVEDIATFVSRHTVKGVSHD